MHVPMLNNLSKMFQKSAAENRSMPAIFWGETTINYTEAEQEAQKVAQHLKEVCGLKPGDRVALWLKNCPEFVSCLFGILHAGGVVVPINNFLKAEEVAHVLTDGEIQLMLTDTQGREQAGELASRFPRLKMVVVDDFHQFAMPSESVSSPATEKDLAVIIYTSGTTGKSKGAMLSHGNLMHNVESCRIMLAAVGEDRFVVLLPMFHSFMLTVGILLPLLVGGSMVLVKSVHPPKNIVFDIIHRGATILPSVPQLFRALCHPGVPVELPLRLCVSGGAPLPREIYDEFTRKFPIPLLEGYGLSEASPVVSFNPIDRPRAGTIGVPISGVEVTIQSDSGEILPAGETGEVCVRGGNVMMGYWRRPEATAQTMREDWLLTGDIGHQDLEGYFYITDRKKDMLLVNGINVYPREIEEVIYTFPGIKEAAVVGQPDQRRGEQPIAFVSLNENVKEDEKGLHHFLKEKLADYKLPRKVIFLPSLPRNATGKIQKTELKKLLHPT